MSDVCHGLVSDSDLRLFRYSVNTDMHMVFRSILSSYEQPHTYVYMLFIPAPFCLFWGFGITLSEVWGLLLALYSGVTPRMLRGLCSAGKKNSGIPHAKPVTWYHVYLCPVL